MGKPQGAKWYSCNYSAPQGRPGKPRARALPSCKTRRPQPEQKHRILRLAADSMASYDYCSGKIANRFMLWKRERVYFIQAPQRNNGKGIFVYKERSGQSGSCAEGARSTPSVWLKECRRDKQLTRTPAQARNARLKDLWLFRKAISSRDTRRCSS